MVNEPINIRFIDGLFNLSQGQASGLEYDILAWLQEKGFGRPQNLVTDRAAGGWVITQKGLDWLESIGRGGETFIAPGTVPYHDGAGKIAYTVALKGGRTQRFVISHEALADHFGAKGIGEHEAIEAFNRGLKRILAASRPLVGHAVNGAVVLETNLL